MGKDWYFKFDTGVWMKDPENRSVSSAARGLWIDMLSLMHESARRGYLKLQNGKIVTAEILARQTGNCTDDTSLWLRELESSGVFSRTDDGCIYCRKMVREQDERDKVRDRVSRHRAKKGCNAVVTPDVPDIPYSNYNSNSDLNISSKEKLESQIHKTSARIHFSIPSLGEISAFCGEFCPHVDPQIFFNHYTSNGWMVGKSHMKDWRSAARNWEKRNGEGQQSNQKTRPISVQIERYASNRDAVDLAFKAAVGRSGKSGSPRQTPRLSSGNNPTLEGEIKTPLG